MSETTPIPAAYLDIFREEVARGAADYAAETAVMVSGAVGAADTTGAFEVYGGQLARAADTAELIGLVGLARAARQIESNVATIGTLDQAARAPHLELLLQWPARFTAYLGAPGDSNEGRALTAYLATSEWPHALAADAVEPLAAELVVAIATAEDDADAPASPPPDPVGAADLSLAIPLDVDDAVREAYLTEAPAHVEQLVQLVPRIVAGSATADERRAAQRYAHSLKGSSNIVGVRGVALLAHPLEDVLEALLPLTDCLDPRLAVFLHAAANTLAQMVGAMLGIEAAPTDALEVVTTARTLAWYCERGDLDGGIETLPAQATAPSAAVFAPPVAAASNTATTALSTPVLRVPVKTVDELFRLLGELGMRVLRLQTALRETRQQTRAMREDLESMGETSIDPAQLLGDMLEGVRNVDTRLLALTSDVEAQERLQRDLGRIALSTRMLPVATLVPRLQRNVQQTCRALGKQAVLRIEGDEILCDGDMLEALADPLLHILRNAIDHGIEAGDQRHVAGKPEAGAVDLVFARRGPVITVTVRDDGRGLDYDAIRAKAIANGLLNPDVVLHRGELAQLTLLPGFSTKSAVSEVSGRGVGMDVVAERLKAMKGTVLIRSEPGAGCEIQLRFQATLVSQHALLVRVADEMAAVPSHHVEFALAAAMGEFAIDAGRPALAHRGNLYPLYSLARLAGFASAPPTADTVRAQPILIVRSSERFAAVTCDRLLDGRELIVKAVGRYLRALPGLAGAVVLPTGKIASVLDVPELLRGELARERVLSGVHAPRQLLEEAH